MESVEGRSLKEAVLEFLKALAKGALAKGALAKGALVNGAHISVES